MDYNQYEKLKEKNSVRNEKLLKDFEGWLVSAGLSSKTVDRHVSNVDFYINQFLTYYDDREAETGWDKIDDFLSDWFIRKAMWASEYSVKQNITSLKKFYLYLVEIELINRSEYNEMLEVIKEKKHIWIRLVNGSYGEDRLNLYNIDDPSEYASYESNSEKLTELFTHIKDFGSLKAWTWLKETDIFGVKFKDEDQIYFCCVLGDAEESYAVSIYKGLEGLYSYFRVLDGDFDLEDEAIHVMDCTTINYENRSDIEDVDYDIIQLTKVKFRGKNQWPCIRVYEPGFYPRALDIENIEEIDELTKVLEVISEYVMYLKYNMDKSSLIEKGKCIVREFDDEKMLREYMIDIDEFFESQSLEFEIPIMYSEIDIRRVIKNCKRTRDTWELDIFNMITPVEEHDDVYFPAVMLIVDIDKDTIIGQHISHPDSLEEFQTYLLNMFLGCKVIPQKIVVTNNDNILYLEDMFDELRIKLDVVNSLKLIPAIKRDMYKFISNETKSQDCFEEIKKIIEKLRSFNSVFPREALQEAIKIKEEITPILLEELDKIVECPEIATEDEDYMLHMYAAYLLAQFREQSAFTRVLDLISFSPDEVEMLFGDVLTNGLSSILYSTFDGQLECLKRVIENPLLNKYARSAALDVYGKLYSDGIVSKKECIGYLKELLYNNSYDNQFDMATDIQGVVINYHLFEMIDDIQYLYDQNRIETMMFGEYDDFIDFIYSYEYESNNVRLIDDAIKEMYWWACFEQTEEEKRKNETKLKKLEESIFKEEKSLEQMTVKSNKVGRNDPCPCGSGKKYKKCCIGKKPPVEEEHKENFTESEEERERWLKYYPKVDDERGENEIRITDSFDEESIDIDKLVYLALHHRAIPLWKKRDEFKEDMIMILYLNEAYEKFLAKCEKEGIGSFVEYDSKYKIHYKSKEWIERLVELMNVYRLKLEYQDSLAKIEETLSKFS